MHSFYVEHLLLNRGGSGLKCVCATSETPLEESNLLFPLGWVGLVFMFPLSTMTSSGLDLGRLCACCRGLYELKCVPALLYLENLVSLMTSVINGSYNLSASLLQRTPNNERDKVPIRHLLPQRNPSVPLMGYI